MSETRDTFLGRWTVRTIILPASFKHTNEWYSCSLPFFFVLFLKKELQHVGRWAAGEEKELLAMHVQDEDEDEEDIEVGM